MKIFKIRRLSTIKALITHPLYGSAKAGCIDSALQLTADILPPACIRPSIICPVIKSSGNKIPLAMTAQLSEQNPKSSFTTDILLSNAKSPPTMAGRIYSNPIFSGTVHPGDYCLVDDVFTTGKTLIALKKYIEQQGGNVVEIICIGSSKATGFELSNLEVRMLKSRFPDISKYYDLRFITKPMARYMLRFHSLQALHLRANDIFYSQLHTGVPDA